MNVEKNKMSTFSIIMMVLLGFITFFIPIVIPIVAVILNIDNGVFSVLSSLSWCFLGLPISLLCIILGFVFTFKKHYGCIANIIIGFVMSIILVIFGIFSLIPFKSITVDALNQYTNATGINLPSVDYIINFSHNTSNFESTTVIEFSDKSKNYVREKLLEENKWNKASSLILISNELLPSSIEYNNDDYMIIVNTDNSQQINSLDQLVDGYYVVLIYSETENKLTCYSNKHYEKRLFK